MQNADQVARCRMQSEIQDARCEVQNVRCKTQRKMLSKTQDASCKMQDAGQDPDQEAKCKMPDAEQISGQYQEDGLPSGSSAPKWRHKEALGQVQGNHQVGPWDPSLFDRRPREDANARLGNIQGWWV